jgi:peptide/nickel transport system permease protein
MSAIADPIDSGTSSPGLWTLAWRRLRADRLAMLSLAVVGLFLAMLVLSSCGLIAADWEVEAGVSYAPPTFAAKQGGDAAAVAQQRAPVADNAFDPLADDLRALRAAKGQVGVVAQRATDLPFGADKWGHDVLKKTIKGGETSIVVGLVAALLAVGLGTIFGAIAGFYGGLVDDLFNWFYNIFTAIPAILMILAVAAVLQHKGVMTIVLILGLTGWTGPFRLIRAEYMKHRERDYVRAADAIGASSWRKIVSHIFPNVSHVALVQLSILAVGFIKAEVILSFLGFGVPVGVVSWGSMLNEAQNELIIGKWWQLAAAASAMALLVTAFSLLTDALRDALDPKIK